MSRQRIYARLEVKSLDDELRIVEGIATTPSTDRLGDIVEPLGAEYQLPIPFLSQHNAKEPIGEVFWVKATKAGIEFKARIAKIAEAGPLKDRIDKAWQEIKYKLVKGVSIGFSELETAQIKDSWSLHFLKWSWLELSAVTIPANIEATITAIKSADDAALAAIGQTRSMRPVRLTNTSGATGDNSSTTQGTNMKKSIAEQIAAFQAKRAANVVKASAIMEKASDGEDTPRTLDQDEQKTYDELVSENAEIDKHISRLQAHEKLVVAAAQAVDTGAGAGGQERSGTQQRHTVDLGDRGNGGHVVSAPNVEKGIAFTRYVKALVLCRGSKSDAIQYAQAQKHWMDQTPQVLTHLKAAVAGGDNITSGWASELVYNQNLVSEFIAFLRPATVLGKIPNLTRVPFNVRLGSQTSGSSAFWVGQGKPVPVSKLGTGSLSLGIAKAAGLVVLTEELVRSSEPSAELLVRNDLADSIAQFLDQQFLSPDYAAVANVSPASMTSGVDPVLATGTTSAALRTDVQTLFNNWISQNLNPTGGVWIMTPQTALAISLMLNALGQPVFPTITMNGGTFFGLPVITSVSATMVGSPVAGEGRMLILLNAPEVLLADEGQIEIDASREASLEMLDNPTNQSGNAGPTATSMVSMFQTNAVALKAVRYINWAKRRTFAVQYIKDAAYVT